MSLQAILSSVLEVTNIISPLLINLIISLVLLLVALLIGPDQPANTVRLHGMDRFNDGIGQWPQTPWHDQMDLPRSLNSCGPAVVGASLGRQKP